jgi:hypothetical protein
MNWAKVRGRRTDFSLFFAYFLGIRAARLIGGIAGRACASDDFFRRGADLRTKLFVGSFGSARCAFDQQLGDLHEIVGKHRGTNQQFESLGALGEATLHAAAAH